VTPFNPSERYDLFADSSRDNEPFDDCFFEETEKEGDFLDEDGRGRVKREKQE
jgi:hypothetical protein